MKFAALTSFVLAALSANAAPTKRNNYGDADIIQYALTLEHLENAFYSGALQKFNNQSFIDAGLPSYAYGRFSQVAAHEATHVDFLTKALTAAGVTPVKPCQYKFPYTDPKSFAALSQVLEGVGVSAYTGAARFIKNGDYLTAAASILATEARHASFVAAAVNNVNGWSGSFDVPLALNQVYTLAAPFFVSCPSDNAPLPVKAFPTLALGAGKPGDTVSVSITPAPTDGASMNIAFYTGLSQVFAPVTNGMVTIPADLMGTVYAVATSVASGSNDFNTAAGPAILQYNFDANGKIIS